MSYYFSAVLAPMWLTTLVSFSAFFSPPNDMSSKIEVLIGCFAAVIAFLFVINDKLPKTPYRHKIDKVRGFVVLTVHDVHTRMQRPGVSKQSFAILCNARRVLAKITEIVLLGRSRKVLPSKCT